MPPRIIGQFLGGDGQFRGCGGGESECPLLQATEVEGKAIAHPAEDLELVAPSVLVDEDSPIAWQ